MLSFSKACSHFSILFIVKIAWGDCAAKKKRERYKKCGSNDDQSWHVTVRECGSKL